MQTKSERVLSNSRPMPSLMIGTRWRWEVVLGGAPCCASQKLLIQQELLGELEELEGELNHPYDGIHQELLTRTGGLSDVVEGSQARMLLSRQVSKLVVNFEARWL